MSVADFALADILVRQIADHSTTVMVVAAAPDFRIIYANRAVRTPVTWPTAKAARRDGGMSLISGWTRCPKKASFS